MSSKPHKGSDLMVTWLNFKRVLGFLVNKNICVNALTLYSFSCTPAHWFIIAQVLPSRSWLPFQLPLKVSFSCHLLASVPFDLLIMIQILIQVSVKLHFDNGSYKYSWIKTKYEHCKYFLIGLKKLHSMTIKHQLIC